MNPKKSNMTVPSILQTMLARYEAEYGEVKIPEQILDEPLPEQKPARKKAKKVAD